MRSTWVASLIAAGACLPVPAGAYFDYPVRPVRIVVGAPAGDTNDLLARIVSPQLTTFFKQPFLIEWSIPGRSWARKVEEVKQNVPLEDAKFNKPQ